MSQLLNEFTPNTLQLPRASLDIIDAIQENNELSIKRQHLMLGSFVFLRVLWGRNLTDIMCFTFIFSLMTVGCISRSEQNTFSACLCVCVCVWESCDLGAPSQGQLVFAAAALHNITINDVGPVWSLLVNHILIIALHALLLARSLAPPSLSLSPLVFSFHCICCFIYQDTLRCQQSGNRQGGQRVSTL